MGASLLALAKSIFYIFKAGALIITVWLVMFNAGWDMQNFRKTIWVRHMDSYPQE